ncbi:MAG TPA: glycosyltransferase [Thermoanaerobaculia bacterium]|nr:glycosyltransferase [Thermoanaerobaculia bacterium]
MLNKTRLAIALAIVLLVPNVTYAHSKQAFHDAMRKLWSDHVAYTRLFIVSALAGSPDTDATTQRLLQNQTDIGNAVAEFYGRDAGNKLEALLEDHILIAASIVTAAKAGDNAKVASENKRWRDNATDIAKFLNMANPKHWPEAAIQSAMFAHLEQTLSEATNQLKGDYAASIKDYDTAMDHILMMADTLSDGIIAQFPSKFSRAGGKKK